MSKKFQFNPIDLDDKPMGELQAYREGPLAVFKVPDAGWTVAHVQSRTRITNSKQWPQKNQARAYALALLEFESINWDFTTKDEMFEKNDVELLTEAYQKGLVAANG